jgi:hypothetical protein
VAGHNARPGGQLHVAQAEPYGGLPILGCQQGITIPRNVKRKNLQRSREIISHIPPRDRNLDRAGVD